MGREAKCICEWNGESAEVTALIEPPDLILRGGLRRKMPLAQIHRISATGANLTFTHGEDRVRLLLGEPAAAKWAKALATAPPSLTKKLGIAAEARVRLIGVIDDDALREALVPAEIVTRGSAEIVLARVDTQAELDRAFAQSGDLVAAGAALWIVYRKGLGQAIGESQVRSAGLAAGIVDVKVVAVSDVLTALKFVKRKGPSLQ